ncbi:MAG: Polyketide cyclase/dehydrase [Frankiales bacterium]|nr:Polyketide cyclase/dehydrase [Frankiales bacterium]
MKASFVVESQSAAPPETVFAVLADGARWQDWAGPAVPRSSWESAAPAGGLGAVRRLGLGPLSSREEIVGYDPPRRLAYVLRSGERLHHYRASVDLRAEPSGGTHIVWSGTVESSLPGLAGPLAGVFRHLVSGFAARLARQAERVAPGQ